MHLRHGQAVWLMVAVTLMWSIAGVVTRQLEHARSFEVTFWRSLFTVLSLLVILPVWQGLGVFRQIHWRSGRFWLSSLCWSVMFTAFMVALTLASVANVLITMAIGPLVTALLARIALHHRLPLRTWLAIAAAGAGIAWMYGSQVSLGDGRELIGALVALCVPLAGAVQWTVVQHSQVHGESIDLVPSVLVGAALSTVVTLPLALPFSAGPRDIAWLGLLGLVQLAIPCVLSVLCARVLKAPEVSLLALLEVVFGIALAWLGANEAPAPTVLLGGSVVIGALLINEWLAWRGRRV
jgi:drug/metabolite transporter (DMT)-like permease